LQWPIGIFFLWDALFALVERDALVLDRAESSLLAERRGAVQLLAAVAGRLLPCLAERAARRCLPLGHLLADGLLDPRRLGALLRRHLGAMPAAV
jgi:hypothetical protein